MALKEIMLNEKKTVSKGHKLHLHIYNFLNITNYRDGEQNSGFPRLGMVRINVIIKE